MITIDADETDLAAMLEALVPGKITVGNGEITVKIKGKSIRLNQLKLEFMTDVTYEDSLQADVAGRIEDGHAHLEAEIR